MLQIKIVILSLLWFAVTVDGHGRLMEPPGRESMWRVGYSTRINYNDNQLNCGGFYRQWESFGGKCGVCGEPWNQAPTDYQTGHIVTRDFTEGQTITIGVVITANHRGWFEFRVCPFQDVDVNKNTQQCLDEHLLSLVDGSSSRYDLGAQSGDIEVKVRLPHGLICTHCLLQWKWHCGNSWGTNVDGTGCLGCGAQEEFYGCADISIAPADLSVTLATGPSTSRGAVTTVTPILTQAVGTTTSTDAGTFNKICKAAGSWEGQANIDRWCAENCARGYCPKSHCKCSKTETLSTTTTTTAATTAKTTSIDDFTITLGSASTTTQPSSTSLGRTICRSAGAFAGQLAIDMWCEANCARGYCPKSHCKCSKTEASSTTTTTKATTTINTDDVKITSDSASTTTQPPSTSLGRTICRSAGAFAGQLAIDMWCEANCARGYCPSSHCICTAAATTTTSTTAQSETFAPAAASAVSNPQLTSISSTKDTTLVPETITVPKMTSRSELTTAKMTRGASSSTSAPPVARTTATVAPSTTKIVSEPETYSRTEEKNKVEVQTDWITDSTASSPLTTFWSTETTSTTQVNTEWLTETTTTTPVSTDWLTEIFVPESTSRKYSSTETTPKESTFRLQTATTTTAKTSEKKTDLPSTTSSPYASSSASNGMKNVQAICKGVGLFRGNHEIDEWCDVNCPRGFCPSSHCECPWHDNTISRVCKSAGLYQGIAAIDNWCEINCDRGYCPSSHCACFNVLPSTTAA